MMTATRSGSRPAVLLCLLLLAVASSNVEADAGAYAAKVEAHRVHAQAGVDDAVVHAGERMLQRAPRLLRQPGASIPASTRVQLGEDIDMVLSNLTIGGGRVAGGVKAKAGQFPYTALLTISESGGRRATCTGTLIKPNVILTAGHCVYGAKAITAQIGLVDQTAGSEVIKGKSAIFPKAYNINSQGGVNQNDIGLVILDRNSAATPAKLAAPSTTLSYGTMITIAGWGITSRNANNLPRYLQVQNFPILTPQQCYSAGGAIPTGHMYCLSWSNTKYAGTTTCSGDSGGGWFKGNVVVATVSGGTGECGARQGADLAVQTSYWTNWINTNGK